MKTRWWLVSAVLFLATGLAAGYAAGKNVGFVTGSEWALVQADIVAREAGVDMPVSYDGGTFRVVIRQPKGLYRRAWQLADRQPCVEAVTVHGSGAGAVVSRADL